MRRSGLVVIAVVLAAGSLAAQDAGIPRGTIEIGGFARYNRPTTAFLVTTPRSALWGAGARIGLFFARNFAVEADLSGTSFDIAQSPVLFVCAQPANTPCPLTYTPVHLQLLYNAPVSERFLFLVGGGVSNQSLSGTIQNSRFGVGGTVGIRWRPTQALSFRFEGALDVLPQGTFNVMNTYLGGQVGVDLLLGGHRCHHAGDAITVSPAAARLEPGQTETFLATATYCGGPDEVIYHLAGPGALDSMTGKYSATEPGPALVVAYARNGRLTATANVTVAAPAPPPPPPPAPVPTEPAPPVVPIAPLPVASPRLPPVTSITIGGASRVRVGARSAYRADLRLADGTPVTRPLTWSIASGTGSIDSSGTLVTTGSGTVTIRARVGDATATYSVASYDWLPFGNGPTVGVALESASLAANQPPQAGYPTLLIGCGASTFVVGVVTQGGFAGNGSVIYRFDNGGATSDSWLETASGTLGFSYLRGGNNTRRRFADRIAASRIFVFARNDSSGTWRTAAFSVAGATSAIAAAKAACPTGGVSRTAAAIDALLRAWREAARR